MCDRSIIHKCRVCLSECEDSMHDLFVLKNEMEGEEMKIAGNEEETNDQLGWNEKVEYCCGVRLRHSTMMPTKICQNCREMTKIWFKFRQLCINAQAYLESLCTETKQCDNYGEYWDYIVEDLQNFRVAAQQKQNAFTMRISANNQNTDDTEDKHYFEYEDTRSNIDKSVIVKVDVPLPSSNHQNSSPESETELDRIKRKLQLKCEQKAYDLKKVLRPASPTSFMCYICGNVYLQKSRFTYHMSMHTDKKPHECELCGKKFRQRGALQIHIRRHTGVKPYKCAHCPRHFFDHSDRYRHERVHTNTRPYACKYCDKSFTYSATLKDHLKVHSGIKEFHCFDCDKSFTVRKNYVAHLQTLTHKQKECDRLKIEPKE